MSRHKQAIFGRSIHTTHLWLRDMGLWIGPDRQRCYHALVAVLHAIRDRLGVEESAHFAAQLPIIVRGLYFHSWNPHKRPENRRSPEAFLQDVERRLQDVAPMGAEEACRAVFHVLDHYVSPEEIEKVRRSLSHGIRGLWRSLLSDTDDNKSARRRNPRRARKDRPVLDESQRPLADYPRFSPFVAVDPEYEEYDVHRPRQRSLLSHGIEGMYDY